MSVPITFALSLANLLKSVALEPLVTAPLLLSTLFISSSSLPNVYNKDKTTTVLAILLVLGLLRRINIFLSDQVLNNWESDTYDWSKELVVVTGGSSGIGELVTQDLCCRAISVAVIDIVEPKYPIRTSV